MTETEKKALALVNEVAKHYRANIGEADFDEVERAFYRAIEQHEAFKREVSDAVEALKKVWGGGWHQCSEAQMCDRFIIPKPDPLVEAVDELWTQDRDKAKYMADQLHKYLAARGLEVRKIGEGE